jgi:hypothetical protein
MMLSFSTREHSSGSLNRKIGGGRREWHVHSATRLNGLQHESEILVLVRRCPD